MSSVVESVCVAGRASAIVLDLFEGADGLTGYEDRACWEAGSMTSWRDLRFL